MIAAERPSRETVEEKKKIEYLFVTAANDFSSLIHRGWFLFFFFFIAAPA